MPPHLVFGAGGIGTTEKSFTYTFDTPEKVGTLLDELRGLGVVELDSAASYPPTNPWNTETLLGQSRAATERGFVVDTKVLVRRGEAWNAADLIEASIDRSLELLGAPRVRTLYAHAPDGVTPLEEQAAAFDKQLRAGKYERYGISNYSAEDVAELFAICERKGYAKPAVYQGMYNALQRTHEADLLPLLRRHGCAYYGYSPLAGGFLTGKVTLAREAGAGAEDPALARTRWQGASAFPLYLQIYDTPAMHAAIRALKAACEAADPPLTLQEASMRWLLHHSALHEGDGVIFGARTVEQLHATVADTRRGPLPEAVLAVVDGLWATARKTNNGSL